MIDSLSHFHFLRPFWLLGTLFAFLVYLGMRVQPNERSDWRRLLSPRLFTVLNLSTGGKAGIKPLTVILLLLGIGCVAVSGPSWNRQVPLEFDEQSAMVVILDSRLSMYATDVAPTRMAAARQKIHDLIQLRPTAHVSVIAYAQSAHIVSPLSNDRAFTRLYLDALEPAIMPATGRGNNRSEVSHLGRALTLVKDVLPENRSELPSSVLVITSGLSQADQAALEDYQADASSSPLQILAVGTAAGGSLQPVNGLAFNQSVDTRMTTEPFLALRKQGVPVTLVSHDGADIEKISGLLRSNILNATNENPEFKWHDRGYYLTGLVLMLCAFWFRKGATVLGLVLCVTLTLNPDTAEANMDWFFTPDQQGEIAWLQGNYARAATLYDTPYKKALSFYRSEQYEQALRLFQTMDTPEALFYQANSYAQLKYWDQAYELLSRLIERTPDSIEVRDNYARVSLIMERLIFLRKQRLMDQQSFDPNDFDKEADITESELAEQGVEARIEANYAELNPSGWLEGLSITPTLLLKNQFSAQFNNLSEKNDVPKEVK
nr:VWA domain-containing protein [Endozoicomonas sp.]